LSKGSFLKKVPSFFLSKGTFLKKVPSFLFKMFVIFIKEAGKKNALYLKLQKATS